MKSSKHLTSILATGLVVTGAALFGASLSQAADPIKLSSNPSEFTIPKSYLNCTEDTALPHHEPWHPRLSQKLGLYRLVQTPGSHELCFTDPALLARKILEAGRD